MKINYDKSDLITLGMTEDEQNSFARLFAARLDSFLSSTWRFLSTMLNLEERISNLW